MNHSSKLVLVTLFNDVGPRDIPVIEGQGLCSQHDVDLNKLACSSQQDTDIHPDDFEGFPFIQYLIHTYCKVHDIH